MFEDFENRSGFWKDLGSNFTINYSGDAPSFLTSGEMWATMDGSETQTLAAWENGWVLTNNPDGTMTPTPKYTSGLISKTLVRVPVGPQSPMSSPTGGVGGVQVAFTADNKTFHATTNAPAFEDGQREWEHGGYTIKQKYIAGTSESLWTIGCMATPTSCKVKATGEFETVATSNTDSTKTHEIDCPYSGTFASSLLLADMMKKADECAEEMEAWVVANPVTDSSNGGSNGGSNNNNNNNNNNTNGDVEVKIDTTQPNTSPDFVVSHSLPNMEGFTPYGTDWAQYKTMPYVENNKDTHCFTVVESNESSVPVGTQYGNCPDENPAESNNLLLYGGLAAVAVVVLLI